VIADWIESFLQCRLHALYSSIVPALAHMWTDDGLFGRQHA
jgi:hypothetical protein